MKKLISMTDYVLELDNNDLTEYKIESIFKYAHFLKQPLELWMFVPCDENGNVFEELQNSITAPDLNECKQYQQAKERCLFEGFEWNIASFCDEPMLELEDKNGNYFCYDVEDKNFSKDDEVFYSTIEDLLRYNLQLTPTAIKQLGL